MASKPKTIIEKEVDRLFNAIDAERGDQCANPVTGGHFVWGVDPISGQKKEAVRALVARERFALDGPPDAPPLPLSCEEVATYRTARGLTGVVGFYARSLALRAYDAQQHPSFVEFARGLMASNTGMWGIENDTELRRRFPPLRLKGMTRGAYWAPPNVNEDSVKSARRAA